MGTLLGAVFSALVPVLAAGGAAVLLGGCASCQSTVRTAAVPTIGAAATDGVVADPTRHRLYLSDRTGKGVDVVDISSTAPSFVGTVALSGSPNGLAMAPERGLLYAAMTGGTVAVIDTGSLLVVDNINIGAAEAGLVDYSPRTQRLYVGTGSGGEVVMIDTTTDKVRLRLAAKTEVDQPRYNPADGMVYVTAPRANSVLQINPSSGNITRTYTIAKCGPLGMAINPARQVALVACGGSVGFLNLQTGAQSVSRVVQGGDLVTYDAGSDRFLLASPHGGTDSAIGVFDGSGGFIGSVTSTPQAHQAAFDSAHGIVYATAPVGLIGFTPGACEPPPDWLMFAGGISVFAIPLLGAAVFLVLYARRMDRPRDRSKPTFRDLHEEDLIAERERIRALEDAIYGPG